jgi:hypothetical protein
MAGKIRKQIYIDTAQEKQLKRIAAKTGESEASVIRRAIDRITADRASAAESGAKIRRPLGPPESWQRALNRMQRSTLIPIAGVKLVDRTSLHER